MNSKMSKIENFCAVRGCKTNSYMKGENVILYTFPSNPEIRHRWISILKERCSSLNSKSKICSKHFERRFLDLNKKLLPQAVPTLFTTVVNIIWGLFYKATGYRLQGGDKNKLEKLLNKVTYQELVDDIKDTISLVKVPDNFSDCVNDDLKCIPNTPVEAQLWLLIRKQDHLITRLNQQLTQNKKHVEVLQKNMDECRASKKSTEQSVETLKYIVKSLQEKQATLEEQIEILTSVESR